MCDYLIIGGGPSALLEAKALLAKGKKVAIVAEQLGGSMVCMGSRRLQSYRHELALKGFDVDIGHYIRGTSISPLATEYMKYMASCIEHLPVQLVTGTVEMIDKGKHQFTCHVNTHQGSMQLIAPNLILATGIMPRSIPNCFSGLTAKNCFEAYQFLDSKAVFKHKHKKVVILGGGNSAFQLARSAYEQGFHTTILAKKYLGLFPQETQDRFALRFPSQRTIEYIWKSQGDKAVVTANFLIYDAIKRCSDGIDVTLDAGDNDIHIAQASYQSIPGVNKGKKSLFFHQDHTIFISAIGTVGRIPQNTMPELKINAQGYVSNDHGQTCIEGLYVTGTLAGSKSVNTMIHSG